MKYYILRTNSVEENLKNTNGYNFKINNLNAERLISDAKDGDIFYLLYILLKNHAIVFSFFFFKNFYSICEETTK